MRITAIFRDNRIIRAAAILFACCLAFAGAAPLPAASHAAAGTAGGCGGEAAAFAAGGNEEPQSWLLKWSEPGRAKPLPGTLVLGRQPETAVWLVRPADAEADAGEWLCRLRSLPGIAYVHPNNRVRVMAAPQRLAAPASFAAASASAANDPELAKQGYLRQNGALQAWRTVREQRASIIAIVDTGIDLDHPDLKANLVSGVNLVDPGKPPEDDNGHGTSVAGVIAAQGNNGVGVAGMIWRAKLMPVKALNDLGDGTEQDLGEGILYAVKHGAKVVVLSVGLYRYSPYMLDIVQYAEQQGVLLVAAAGNDGEALGGKAAVKYPAAYPTVLAVGGVRPDNKPDPRSNPGPEVDLAAPWQVYTTAMGGVYKQEEGTSMAAPQAAAAAALVWAQYPGMKPYQVRELLRQTTLDVGAPGTDRQTGYGLLRVDRAVSTPYDPDYREPNDSRANAAPIPLGKQVSGLLGPGGDADWYAVDAPSDGTISIDYRAMPTQGVSPPRVYVSHDGESGTGKTAEVKLTSSTIEFEAKKGLQYIAVRMAGGSRGTSLPYALTPSFRIGPDAYESNDKSYEATTLQPGNRTVVGTFHQTGDRDWFVMNVTHGGKLSLKVSTDTVRIDPGLAVQRAGQSLNVYDDAREGETEQSPVMTVTPGKYYVRVHNAFAAEASPVTGTYSLDIRYTPKYEDPNEPNDRTYEALLVTPGTEYVGVIGREGDADWFQLRLAAASVADLALSRVPAGRSMKLELFDKGGKAAWSGSTGDSKGLKAGNIMLKAGVYYVRLTADRPFDNQYYRLKVTADELTAGFRDIKGHWAQSDIAAMKERGIVSGSGAYRFEPDRSITRGEAVAMLAKAFRPAGFAPLASGAGFRDVSAGHWAYLPVAQAAAAGWISGYPDGTFKPDRPVTREEMAVILSKAAGAAPVLPGYDPFPDVRRTDWSAPYVYAMKLKGWVEGSGARFLPKKEASRAEYTALLHRIIR